jgi:hypothetical protein
MSWRRVVVLAVLIVGVAWLRVGPSVRAEREWRRHRTRLVRGAPVLQANPDSGR